MSNHSDKSQRKKPGPLLMRAYEATEVMIKCARVVLLLCVLAILYFSLTSTAPGVACSFCTFFISLMMLGGFFHEEILYLIRRFKLWRMGSKYKGVALPSYLRVILHQKVKICRRLPEHLRPKLEEKISIFLDMVKFREQGIFGGLVSHEMRLCVAAEACLLILNRNYHDYRWLRKVVICTEMDEAGTASRSVVHLRQDCVQAGLIDGADGHSVTLHEFAHVLDMGDDHKAQSIPVSKKSPEYERWEHLLDVEYERVKQAYASGENHVIDKYALEESEHMIGRTSSGKAVSYFVRSEFFPCATEAFFECSTELRDSCPEIYNLMKEFYQLDPAEWPPPKLP